MPYRLYLDETGTQDITNVNDENNRYFSLCGAIMDVHISTGDAVNYMNIMKSKFFTPIPDQPLIIHRSEIMNREGPFSVLKDPEIDSDFQRWLIRYLKVIQYKIICVVIDKRSMLRQEHWTEKNLYHFCLKIMLEKYIQWLERNNAMGDVIIERTGKREDKELEKVYDRVLAEGSDFLSAEKIQKYLTAKKLKMRHKYENIAGLQLVDLIANPAYRCVRKQQNHNVELVGITKKITDILIDTKFDRSFHGKIEGYGTKYLP